MIADAGRTPSGRDCLLLGHVDLQLLHADRLAEQVPLAVVAVERGELRHLLRPLDPLGHDLEVERARQIRPWLSGVDLLLDIHSMQHKTDPLIIAGPAAKGRTLARAIGWPGIVVTDKGHAEGQRMRDFRDLADPASERLGVSRRG